TATEMSAMGPEGPLPKEAPLEPGPVFRGTSAGGAYSTADDMRRFLTALTSGKLVSRETYERMISPQILAYPGQDGRPDIHYGLGFGTSTFDGHKWVGHNGGAPGINAEVNFFIDDQTMMVVLSNRDPPAASALYRELRGVVFGKSC
ncbi:MAG TPA: serine hydrolase domain-containing protein, partial [Magnetospirillaceae bacterium]|nr:serine hydrolase domain-containing protein [Magnetospirillaceae bacterium]